MCTCKGVSSCPVQVLLEAHMPSERSTSCRRYAVALQAWAGVRPSWHGQALCASEERAELLRIMARAMLGRHAEELLDEVVSDETDRGGRDDLDVQRLRFL